MATKKPKVGDPAIIDDAPYTVIEVTKAKVSFGDESRVALKERVDKLRAEAAAETESLEARFATVAEEATAEANREGIPPKSMIEARTAVIKAEMVLHNSRLQAKLDAVPSGVKVGAAAKDVYWVESEGCFSIPGRFHAYVPPQDGQRGYRPADPKDLQEAAGRRR